MKTRNRSEIEVDVIVTTAIFLGTAYEVLADEVREVGREVHAVHKAHGKRLRSLARAYHEARKKLEAEVEAHPEYFEKPKSRQVENVRFGYRKLKGRTVLPKDTDKLLDKLAGLLDDEAYARCVKPVMKPIASEIAELPGSMLKRLGVTIEEDRDAPFVTVTQSGVEADVEAMLCALESGEKEGE